MPSSRSIRNAACVQAYMGMERVEKDENTASFRHSKAFAQDSEDFDLERSVQHDSASTEDGIHIDTMRAR